MISIVNINDLFYIIVKLLTKDSKQIQKLLDFMSQAYIVKLKYYQ